MTLLENPRFSGWARGHLVCRVDGIRDRFALTFDDGPAAGSTPGILEVLERFGARATFFTLAPNARRNPALLRRMTDEGHEIAAHGDLHWPLPLLPPFAIRREVARSIAAVEAAGAPRPRFYRPAFGFMMPGQAAFVRRLGVEPVLGDVYPEDPRRPGVETIVRRTMRWLIGGSIVILHDGDPTGRADRRQTLEALPIILARAREAGLEAVTVGTLLEAGLPRWQAWKTPPAAGSLKQAGGRAPRS